MIEHRDGVVEASAFPGRQGRLAFVYLASEHRRVDRHQLADVLWEELPDQWEGALAAIGSKLRNTLGRAGFEGSSVLDTRDGSFELRFPPGTWVDLQYAINSLDRAEGHLRSGEAKSAWTQAAPASAIFRRSFLAGETGPWVERMRRDLHEYEIRTFDALAVAWLALDQPGLALQAAQHVRDLAPYRESAHTRVMESHLAAGNRTEVVKAFDELRNMLVETMGLEPGPESDELFQRALG